MLDLQKIANGGNNNQIYVLELQEMLDLHPVNKTLKSL